MDFSKFSDDNFEVKDWINNALRVQKDSNVSLETQTSNLVMKLQLFIQEVNKSLEETSQVALNNLPRVLREVETVKTESGLLQNQMQLVKDDIRKVEENTAQSMKRLVEIDVVKGRMQDASSALQEADNWSTLSSEVNDVFESSNVMQIAEKLIGMQKSLQVLQDVPDYEDRYRLLETLKNKLEAVLSTKLVTTFNTHNLEDAKYYVQIFTELDRLSQLQTYYNNCHKSSLVSTWSEIRDDPNKPMVSWLPTFFDHLLALWHREITWCGQVFPQPVHALSNLLSQAINNLHPSIPICIEDALKDEEDSLETLIQLLQIARRFISGLESAVRTYEAASPSSPLNPAALQLIADVQSPFQRYLLQYSEFQQQTLMKGLENMTLSADDLADSAEVMIESVNHAFRLADKAKEACFKFTKGYGSMALLEALQMFFSAYFGRLDAMMVDLRKTCHLTEQDRAAQDTADADVWLDFQNAFKLIEMCGCLLNKMDVFREGLSSDLSKCLQQLVPKSMGDEAIESSINFNYLKLSRPADWDSVLELNERLESYGVQVILPVSSELVERLNEHAHKFAFDIVFVRLRNQLAAVPEMREWNMDKEEAIGGELPTFSLSPLSYITQVGDCLLTLPQQLEPYFVQDNDPLMRALQAGKVPFTNDEGTQAENIDFDHIWLNGLATGTTSIYTECIKKIKHLTPHSSTQLVADIEYFCNILEALEIHPNDELTSIKELVDVSTDGFYELADELSADELLQDILAKMRNITH